MTMDLNNLTTNTQKNQNMHHKNINSNRCKAKIQTTRLNKYRQHDQITYMNIQWLSTYMYSNKINKYNIHTKFSTSATQQLLSQSCSAISTGVPPSS